MYRLVVLKSAAEDIKESSDWYEQQQKGLGKNFRAKFYTNWLISKIILYYTQSNSQKNLGSRGLTYFLFLLFLKLLAAR